MKNIYLPINRNLIILQKSIKTKVNYEIDIVVINFGVNTNYQLTVKKPKLSNV